MVFVDDSGCLSVFSNIFAAFVKVYVFTIMIKLSWQDFIFI